MQVAEPLVGSWKAVLALEFDLEGRRTRLIGKRHEGPLVVQKPLYPEGEAVCHAIVVHPPAGIAGGDELEIDARVDRGAHALLTTPGATRWYRSSGAWANQGLSFEVDGTLEYLPQETIVYDGALALMRSDVRLSKNARYLGWEIVCLGRTGSGERFDRGECRLATSIARNGKPIWFENGRIEGGGALQRSPAGLGGRSVFATLLAAAPGLNAGTCRHIKGIAVTALPELLIARYLGDSSEEAKQLLSRAWDVLRPLVCGRTAAEPRIWRT